MPRNQNAGNLALRNRNRVTNKTRLKVIKGNIDADPIVLDEDEERARVVSTAGVDAEDANEHHLQAVLSAASHRATTHAQRTARGTSGKTEKKNEPTTLIPVPDAAGVVENFADLYPPNRWVNPASYVKFSDVVEECITTAIADGYTYFMDERDVEWLEKNNKDARGEGTSTQSPGSSGTTTRSGALQRSAKSRGKEPEMHQATTMSEDQFELVMGLFEKITHDNTPFLHVSVQQGADIPSFSDYQDAFGYDLPASYFATHLRPANISPPVTLVKMARAVYPHWRTRKLEREGHRIIPTLNYDESDTKNESYICFRRREIKAIRKTRAAQVSSSEKLIRLRGELNSAFELSKIVLAREAQKREVGIKSRELWERRMVVADLKRQYPQLGAREDEEMLFDKERIPKRPRPSDASTTQPKWPNKIRPSGDASSPVPVEPQLRPRERTNRILHAIEDNVKRQKERDLHWEDQIDNPYQPLPVPFGERLFRDLTKVQDVHTLPPSARQDRSNVLVRSRVGRGGLRTFDRRYMASYAAEHGAECLKQIYNIGKSNGEDEDELNEWLARVKERYRFDGETISPDGSTDEEDRIVLDDFHTKYLRQSMTFLHDSDHAQLNVDSRSRVHAPETHTPFAHQSMRRESLQAQRPQPVSTSPLQAAQSSSSTIAVNGVLPASVGVPVSVHTPIRQMSQPGAVQPIRVPSNGPQRPPSAASPTNASAPSSSPLHRPSSAAMGAPNVAPSQSTMNGTSHSTVITGQAVTLAMPNGQAFPNGVKSPLESGPSNHVPVTTPPRPTSQNQMHNTQHASNGVANYAALNLANSQYRQIRGMFNGDTKQQLQQNILHQQLLQQQRMNGLNAAAAYPHLMNGGMNGTNINNLNMPPPVNINLKLPVNRQVAWQRQQQHQQQAIHNEMMQAAQQQLQQMAAINGTTQVPLLNGHLSSIRPSQSPSNNMMMGQHPDSKSPTLQHLQHAHSPHLSPPQAHLSPPRNMQTPIPNSSPLPQHQHIANGANHGQGY